jgi:hypothetical protein
MCVVGAINNYTAALEDSSSPCNKASILCELLQLTSGHTDAWHLTFFA